MWTTERKEGTTTCNLLILEDQGDQEGSVAKKCSTRRVRPVIKCRVGLVCRSVDPPAHPSSPLFLQLSWHNRGEYSTKHSGQGELLVGPYCYNKIRSNLRRKVKESGGGVSPVRFGNRWDG